MTYYPQTAERGVWNGERWTFRGEQPKPKKKRAAKKKAASKKVEEVVEAEPEPAEVDDEQPADAG